MCRSQVLTFHSFMSSCLALNTDTWRQLYVYFKGGNGFFGMKQLCCSNTKGSITRSKLKACADAFFAVVFRQKIMKLTSVTSATYVVHRPITILIVTCHFTKEKNKKLSSCSNTDTLHLPSQKTIRVLLRTLLRQSLRRTVFSGKMH